jgi:acetyl-CoA carboxylase biotin carboxylase subunit
MGRIQTLLIANRGEIARRIIQTCHELGVSTVAVYSDADIDMPYVREADRALCIGPPPAGESYLNVEALLQACKTSGADALHPGYGFLAENAAFAQAVIDAGITWVGPPPSAIDKMGDKSTARTLVAAHDVPTVPGYDGEDSDAALLKAAESIGYPLLVKAAAGGGGRGMRRVEKKEDLPTAIEGARREAEGAFGDPKLLLERYLAQPRHIEVQIMTDAHGNGMYLFERECSIQRRHQKIIEEAPSPGVGEELRDRMGQAALRVAQSVDYVGAGTVEFLMDESGSFYFLEMNTRLQVEHPVTELITGLDLVAMQLEVAEGHPLPVEQEELYIDGHAIEARIYAEDPNRDYLPSSGEIVRFDLPEGDGVRVDSGFAGGGAVSTFYDSMLAKLITWGPDRSIATRRMSRALEKAWVPGLATNLPLLRETFRHAAWGEGALHTHFLDQHQLPTTPPLNLERGAIAATLYDWLERRKTANFSSDIRLGWRVEGPAYTRDSWRSLDQEVTIAWRSIADDTLEVLVDDGAPKKLRYLGSEGDELRLELDGVCHRWRVAHRAVVADRHQTVEDNDVVYVHLGDGESVVSLVPRFPSTTAENTDKGSCIAPTPGTVVKVHVAVGDTVEQGQSMVTMEAMKMEHVITAPGPGTVDHIAAAEGDSVDEGMVLVHLKTDDEPAEDESK